MAAARTRFHDSDDVGRLVDALAERATRTADARVRGLLLAAGCLLVDAAIESPSPNRDCDRSPAARCARSRDRGT